MSVSVDVCVLESEFVCVCVLMKRNTWKDYLPFHWTTNMGKYPDLYRIHNQANTKYSQ